MKELHCWNETLPCVHGTWLWLFCLAAGSAFGQPQSAREVVPARERLMLVREPEVQKKLAFDAQQCRAVMAVVDQADLALWQLRDLPGGQGNPLARPLHQQLRDGLAAALRPEQIKRLDQLVLRLEGWRTWQLPSVADQLNLTDEQKEEYTRFMGEFQNLAGKIPDDIGLPEYRWIRRVLTAGQREKLGQLLGPPFDFSRCQMLEVKAPEIARVDCWINSAPLKLQDLRGKVVVVNFWTHGCINCIHNLPHYRKWFAQLPRDAVTMIAFHTPETPSEHDLGPLRRAVKERDLRYPIAVDNQKENWKAWGNDVWPSVYLVDKQGYVRYWWYGELNWRGATGEEQMLDRIYQLLAEKEPAGVVTSLATAAAR